MTPYQLDLCADAFNEAEEKRHDQAAWMMWHGSALNGVAFSSAKKFPPLDNFLSSAFKKKKTDTSNTVDERAIMARLMAYKMKFAAKKEGLNK